MESNELTEIGGLLKEAFTSSLNGFDDLGADYIDKPTQTAVRKGLFSFQAQADNPTVSFNTGNQTNTFYFTGGFTSGAGSSVSVTLTGITEGTYITVQCAVPIKFGFSNISATGGLGDKFEVYWEGLTDASSIDIKDLGATRPILSSMDNTFSKLDLRGNSVSGDFPNDVTVSDNLYIQGNEFSGGLPAFSNSMVRYQANDNKFRGDIPDISSSTSIKSFLVYNQRDDSLPRLPSSREMITGTIPNLFGCTSLEFFHVGAGPSWVDGFKNRLTVASDFDVPVSLSKFFASNCNISKNDVDKILFKFAERATTSPNIIDLSGTNGYPSDAGQSYANALISRGWTVKLPAQ